MTANSWRLSPKQRKSALQDDDIVAMMLGRRLDRLFPQRKSTIQPKVALKLTGLRVGRNLQDVSFGLHVGEILGVAGLQGHGQRELMMALFGAEKSTGAVEVWGKAAKVRGPRHALSDQIRLALCPRTVAIRL